MTNDLGSSNVPPSFPVRAFRYTRALSRWIKAGRPVREQEEIKTIFMKYCQRCEAMDAAWGRCIVCGCHVGIIKSPLLNKIAMATEHCPQEKW